MAHVAPAATYFSYTVILAFALWLLSPTVLSLFSMLYTHTVHGTWFSLSLYALQYWASRNYYIDYSANVDKIAIRGHKAISSSNPDTRTLFQCAKSIPKPNVRSPKAIRFKSGAVAFSRSQISQRWSQHFCQLFPGNETTWSSLLHNSKTFQAVVNDPECPDNIVLEGLVFVFKHFFEGKAFGTDGLPPGIFKLAPEKVAKLWLLLFRRASATRIENIQFKGGVIMDLLKSAGFDLDCSAPRGILLNNIPGKSYRKLVRTRTMPYLQDSALHTMCGGTSQRGCDFASHLLNATLDLARLRKRSIATFVVNVIAAFDSVLHSFIVDLKLSDEDEITWLR